MSTAAKQTVIRVDLRKFTSGFAKTPVFALSAVSGGTVTADGPGNCLVAFKPLPNRTGRARFDFTVKDGDGSTWKQTCAVLITSH